MTNEVQTPLLKRPTRLVDEVYQVIYAQLMSLKIPPGGRLSVDNLVRELGVSQTPIREALARLESQGLVVKTHLIGYSAAGQMDRDRFEQLCEMRLLIEPYAAAQAAKRLRGEDCAEIVAVNDTMQQLEGQIDHQSYGNYAHYDGALHDLIARASRNEILVETLARLHTHVHLFRLHYHSRVTTSANEEHQRIVDAICGGDAETAESEMRTHIQNSRARFLPVFADRQTK